MITKEQVIRLLKEEKYKELHNQIYELSRASIIINVCMSLEKAILVEDPNLPPLDSMEEISNLDGTVGWIAETKIKGLYYVTSHLSIDELGPLEGYVPTTPRAEATIKKISKAIETLDKVLEKYRAKEHNFRL